MLTVGGKKPLHMSFAKRTGSSVRYQAQEYLRICRGANVSLQFGKSWISAGREVLTLAHSEGQTRHSQTVYKTRQDARVVKNQRVARVLW